MVRPRVADEGDDLHMCRVAANMFQKQSRLAEKGWSSILGVGRVSNNSLVIKEQLVTKHYTEPPIWIHLA